MKLSYEITKQQNAAVVIAAHPRKEDKRNRSSLQDDPELFFEETMGSSHFINSTGSLWAVERRDREGYTLFLGGRQRGDGNYAFTLLQKEDDESFSVLPDIARTAPLVLNTEPRRKAWKLLPEHPQTFGYREGEELVQPKMKSSSTYAMWMRQLRKSGLVLEVDDKLQKAANVPEQ